MPYPPGNFVGDVATIGGVEYTWNGLMWDAPAPLIETSNVNLSSPTRGQLQSVPIGPDGYPLPDGFSTQVDANNYFAQATTWLRDATNDSGVTILSDFAPSTDDINQGTLWIDTVNFNLYVFYGTSWIQVASGGGSGGGGNNTGSTGVIQSLFAPPTDTTPEGTLWVNTNNFNLYVLNGTSWIELTVNHT